MSIINHDDVIKKGNPVKELTKSLEALIKVEDELIIKNKAVAESIDLIKKSSDGSEAKKLTEATDKLKKSTSELTEIQRQELKLEKQLKTAQAQLIAGDTKEAQELAKLNAKKKDQRDLNKANATLNNKLAGTEERLLALNVKARLERKKLNLETKKGQDRLKELNAVIDKNNVKIKKNADALKRQKIGIGKYGQALKGLGSKVVGAFVVVQALRGAFNVLTNVIGATAEGQLFLAKATGAANAILATLRDSLIDGWNVMTDFNEEAEDNRTTMEKLGDTWSNFISVRGEGFTQFFKGLGTIFKGELKEGLTSVSDGFVQITHGIEDASGKTTEFINKIKIAADFGAAIAGAEKNLELERSKFAIEQAKDIRTIADLRVKAADKANFSAKEREGFLMRALSLTRELGSENIKFAKRELGLQQAVFNANKSNIDEEIELNKLKQKADEIAASSLKKQKLLTAELQTAKREAAKEDLADTKKIAKESDKADKAEADRRKTDLSTVECPVKKKKDCLDKTNEAEIVASKTIKDELADIEAESFARLGTMNDNFRKSEATKDSSFRTKKKQEDIKLEDALFALKNAAITAGGQILTDSISLGIDAQADAAVTANEEEQARNETNADADKEILSQNLEDGLITEKEFKEESAKIDDDLRVKNEKLEKDSKKQLAIADKKKALFDIGIATAVGIARVIPQPIAMALAATLGALQLAVVAARPIPKFEKGEVNIDAPRHSQGGMLAEVEGGESWINRGGTANAPKMLNDINNGLFKDSDIDMMKNNDHYSYNMLQLNGLVDEMRINGSLTKETNKILSQTVNMNEQGKMLAVRNYKGDIIKYIIKD